MTILLSNSKDYKTEWIAYKEWHFVMLKGQFISKSTVQNMHVLKNVISKQKEKKSNSLKKIEKFLKLIWNFNILVS